ncbi:MAG: SGNH/GDSL hydrolase family protein [Bryobacteraceae bacterium]
MRRVGLVLCALLATAAAMQAADSFGLKDGDRVVFYGDSITDQRLYTVIAETYVATRYPDLQVSFVHSGWGGDKVSGGGGGPIDERLKRDVLPYKPTVVTIMLGMNDGLYRAETEANDRTFFDGMRHIIDSLKAGDPGVRITLIQPSPYDDVTRLPNFPGGYNEVMLSFSKWLANYAAQNGMATTDFNRPMTAMLRNANELAPEDARKILPDRVHPSFAGHLVMAEQLLKSWEARPTVASVSIQSSDGSATLKSAEYARVSDLHNEGNAVSWTEIDAALPLPFNQWEGMWGSGPVALVLKSGDVTQTLNQEPLTVTGLQSGVYSIKIDGTAVATVNDDELARGVNLAILKTPMTEQAKKVYDLTVSHCNIHNERWRTIQVPLADDNLPQTAPAMAAADALERAVIDERHRVAEPTPHHFEIVAVK